MSEATPPSGPEAAAPPTAAPPSTPQAPGETKKPSFGLDEIVFSGLVVLSVVGMGITDYSENWSLRYWLAMVPIFAAYSIASGWARARREGQGVGGILTLQVLHWLALVLAVLLVYLYQRTDRIDEAAGGFVTLLALALATSLAGVHFDRRLGVLGLVLGAAAAAAAVVQQFVWLLVGVALLGTAGFFFWQRQRS